MNDIHHFHRNHVRQSIRSCFFSFHDRSIEFSGDIVIERWIPYSENVTKRKTIVQRAAEAKAYPKPRNIIIEYEPVPVRVNRQFQSLGVTQADPQAYLQRYGNSLLDSQTLIAQARAAGVVEDLVRHNSDLIFLLVDINICLDTTGEVRSNSCESIIKSIRISQSIVFKYWSESKSFITLSFISIVEFNGTTEKCKFL